MHSTDVAEARVELILQLKEIMTHLFCFFNPRH